MAGLFILTGGQAQLKIGGEVRTRGEERSGFRTPLEEGQHAAFVANLRTRLFAGYTIDKMEAKITVQDSRTFGQTAPGSTGSLTGLYEAWGKYAFNDHFSFKVGRQVLDYDDRRLFTPANWSNTGNSHDALLLDYTREDFKINLVGGWNNESDVLAESPYHLTYKSLLLVWAAKQFGPATISAIYVNDGFQKGDEPEVVHKRYIRNTLGGNVLLEGSGFPLSAYLTGYYQFGDDPEGKQLNAFLLAVKADYDLNRMAGLTVGADYLSGSADGLDGDKNRTFMRLYGANHAFNGSIEYWRSYPTQGLTDIYAGVTVLPLSGLAVNATWHHFSTVKEVTATGKKGLGSEVDLTIDYLLSPQVALQGGWSCYFTTKTMDVVKRVATEEGKFPQWAYLMVTFRF